MLHFQDTLENGLSQCGGYLTEGKNYEKRKVPCSCIELAFEYDATGALKASA
jgi:hypothetical protein